MPEYAFHLEDSPPQADIDAIHQGLYAYNQLHAPSAQGFQSLNIFLRDETGRVAGGLLGNMYWGWLYISTLWLEEAARRHGLGKRLLALAEDEARRRGCHHAYLDTMSFQARPFYEKVGYTLWGQLDDFPVGHSRYFLQKAL